MVDQLESEPLTRIRQLADRALNEALEAWIDTRNYRETLGSRDDWSLPVQQLSVTQALLMWLDGGSRDRSALILTAHETNENSLKSMRTGKWTETIDQRPLLMSAYLAGLWIPALGNNGQSLKAIQVATQFLLQLRGRRFRRVLGAGDGGIETHSNEPSLRLMFLAPVLNALVVSVPPSLPEMLDRHELAANVRYFLDQLFRGDDLSPCTAIWGPALALVAGLSVDQCWISRELANRDALRAAYLDAFPELAESLYA